MGMAEKHKQSAAMVVSNRDFTCLPLTDYLSASGFLPLFTEYGQFNEMFRSPLGSGHVVVGPRFGTYTQSLEDPLDIFGTGCSLGNGKYHSITEPRSGSDRVHLCHHQKDDKIWFFAA